MNILLRLLNLVLITLIAITFTKDNIIYVLGGSLVLLMAIPILIMLSISFKRYAVELQLSLLLILGIFGWQYLNYYKVTTRFNWSVLISFLALGIPILASQAYVILKPFHPQKKLFDENIYKNKRIIFQSVLIRVYFYGFVGLFFTFLFGFIIISSEVTYLVRSNIISFVPVGILWLAISNLGIFIYLRKVSDDYFDRINSFIYLKQIKYTYYSLGILFVIGAVVEFHTRQEIILYIATYIYLFSILLLIGKVYSLHEGANKQKTVLSKGANVVTEQGSRNLANAMELYWHFFLKFVLVVSVIGTIVTMLFILLLQSIK